MRTLFPAPKPDIDQGELAELYAWPPATAGSRQAPWVRANFAASADGAARGPGGLSRSVSGVADRQVFALLRATCDAVVVGAGTARAEDYGPVNVRAELSELRTAQDRLSPPTLVVISGSADLDPAARMFARPEPRTIVVTTQAAAAESRSALAQVADVQVCGERTVDLPEMLALLAGRGLTRLLCEGGPQLFASLLDIGAINELCLTTSPLLVGPRTANPSGGDDDPGRITAGSLTQATPSVLTLQSLVESDSTLLARYAVVP